MPPPNLPDDPCGEAVSALKNPCNVENMRIFIAALRSGEYVQGQKKLELVSEDGPARNCCLGVACRVAQANGVELTTKIAFSHSRNSEFVRFGMESNFLPEPVATWLGVAAENNPMNPLLLTEDGNWYDATDLNDNKRYTFDQIADAFERTYLTD